VDEEQCCTKQAFYAAHGLTEELDDISEALPLNEVFIVWPDKHSCTNEHFSPNIPYKDHHSVEIKPFYFETPFYDESTWETTFFQGAPDTDCTALASKAFEEFKGKTSLCFIMIEMCVYGSVSDREVQGKKPDKAEARKNLKNKLQKKEHESRHQKGLGLGS
jgi:hypothetical protein